MRGSLMFIQKLRVNGRLSLSSTQTTPTFSIAAMRAFSSAGSAGNEAERHRAAGWSRRPRRTAGDWPAMRTPVTRAGARESSTLDRLDRGAQLDRAAELADARGDPLEQELPSRLR